MRIRISDRILVAVAGLILLCLCAGVVAQVFFSKDVIGFVTNLLSVETSTGKAIIGIAAGALLILGLYCLMMLFRHRRRKDKFVVQKLESGDLAISLKTMETMVQKCLDQHPEIKTDSVRLENQRDGLLIRIRGIVAGGISIPLTVDTLQKQVKQYVTACSGVEVKGIRIQIESSGEDAKDAPFLIEPPVNNLLPRGGEPAKETPEEQQPVREETAAPCGEKEPVKAPEPEKMASSEETAAAAAMAAAASLMDEAEIEDDRPIHQQLFSTQEEPCIMPLPPEDLGTAEEELPGNEETDKTEDVQESAEKAEETAPVEKSEEAVAAEKTEEAASAEDVKGEENA